jgi:hypothetical protein
MSLLLSGTDGLSDVDGTAATPAIRGTDANTGIFFPAADTIAFSEGGAEVMRIASTANVGIGTTSPAAKLDVGYVDGNVALRVSRDASNRLDFYQGGGISYIDSSPASAQLAFATVGTERARIDSSGNLLVNSTANFSTSSRQFLKFDEQAQIGITLQSTNATTGGSFMYFANSSSVVAGFIAHTGATTVAYNTSSDYRLKENVAPMTGALAKVQQLKPVTYTWKSNGSAGQGFIAHELQAVVPDCVTGEKDAVEIVDEMDTEGRKIGTKEVPRYQGVDSSFLVATIVAALQEQQAIITQQQATISAMETRLAALEA